MLGEWSVAESLAFTPRFAFEPGTTYRVAIKDVFETTFAIPAAKAVPGKVSTIYPAAEKLPANLLRFYIHFDREMKSGQGYGQFSLLDDQGKAMPFAFLELDEELWSADGKRLTLLLDPGRVKRELVPHKELGPVLLAGKSYTLRIAKEYQTKSGQPLANDYRKTFNTVAPVDAGLEPAKSGPSLLQSLARRGAVKLKFPVLMDHALLNRVIAVQSAEGKIVEGAIVADDDDTHWRWTPKSDWQTGRYSIVIDDVLEDVCGNRIGAAFDAVLGKVGARQLKAPTRLAFQVQ